MTSGYSLKSRLNTTSPNLLHSSLAVNSSVVRSPMNHPPPCATTATAAPSRGSDSGV